MKFLVKYLENNIRYINPIYIQPVGIMLHSTGTPQPRSDAYISNWNSKNSTLCVHGIVDGLTGDYTQLLPYNYKANHCEYGKAGSGNLLYLSVEMCEPVSIIYTSGASFVVVNAKDAAEVAKRTYTSAVKVFAKICKEYGWNPLNDGVIIGHAEGYQRGIASNHADPEHLWKQLKLKYTMDTFRSDVAAEMGYTEQKKTVSDEFASLSEKQSADKLLEICKDIAPEYGLLPSVCCAQTILESGYCKTDLAKKANNVCGLKCTLSGNTWAGSTWDGVSKYTKKTAEQTADGKEYYVTADFRKYSCIEDSIKDRCAYLIGAKNGSKLRYDGIKNCKDYAEQIELIRKNGYATDIQYVNKICDIIRRFDLSRYDNAQNITNNAQKGRNNDFVDLLLLYDDRIQSGIKNGEEWIYSNSGTAKSWANALKKKKYRCNCAKLPVWALKELGIMPADGSFWGNRGSIHWDEETERMIKEKCSVLEIVGARKLSELLPELVEGDIVLYQDLVHTNVYIGNGMFVDAGSAYQTKKGEGQPYDKSFVGKMMYGSEKISYIIRINNKKNYRIQAGAYLYRENAEKMVSKLSEKGFASFIEFDGKNYVVIAGSYTVKSNADDQVAKIKKAGITVFIQ